MLHAASLCARGKGEIFESDDESFRAVRHDAILLSERASEPHNMFIASQCITKVTESIYLDRRRVFSPCLLSIYMGNSNNSHL